MELKELNWLRKHLKNVRSSQPYISMNLVLNSAKHNFFHVSIVKGAKNKFLVCFDFIAFA